MICVMFTVLMVFLVVEWLQAEPPVGLFAPPAFLRYMGVVFPHGAGFVYLELSV